jgi:general secretion pathway protein A
VKSSPIYATLGLSRNPFPPTPDAGSYFFTPRLEEDFAEIMHCIEARKGFVLLTGEVGQGKSTLVRRLLDTLQDKNCNSALILNTFLQDSALLAAIQADFRLPGTESLEHGLASLTDFLIVGHRAGAINLLVIDDAQNLSVESLELVRLLCNLETDQEKLLQILIVGQPELEQTLATPQLRQLKSRIVKHARLNGLQKAEVARYFDFRVNAAGAEGRLSIEPSAAEALYRATYGNLRRIHLVLDRCLYGLASARASVVTTALVQRAVADLPTFGENDQVGASLATRLRPRKAWILGGVLAGAATATVAVAVANMELIPQSQREPQAAAVKKMASAAPVPTSPVTPSVGQATAEKAVPAPAVAPIEELSPRRACENRLEAIATPSDVLHVQRLPKSMPQDLKPSPRFCSFTVEQDTWLAWLGRSETHDILAAQHATRKVQEILKGMGLLDVREPDGLFGLKTRDAFARFQQQHGLVATGNPDDLTFLLLEHRNATAH